MPRRNSNRAGLILIGVAAFFALVVAPPLLSAARAQDAAAPKRIVALYWYNRETAADDLFSKNFQAVLHSEPPGTIEYYAEYLESDRFPGENQSQLLRDYLRQKYSDRPIDVLVATADAPLDFLLKYRAELFTNVPLVYLTSRRPTERERYAGAGITGVLQLNAYKETIELALKLHPNTEQVFIVSGTLEHDKNFEMLCSEQLRDYEGDVSFNYLTDLTQDELVARISSLPDRSIILYIWQQSRRADGSVQETREILDSLVASAHVPIYGIANWQVGRGVVGGYVRSIESNGAKTAEIALRIVHGEKADNIPVESIPIFPMFDWQQIQRWDINQALLPPDRIMRNQVPSFWDQYKWYVTGLFSLVVLQTVLIAGLVANRTRRRRAEVERERFASQADADRRHLNEVLSHLPGVVWETQLKPDNATRQAVYVNQYAEKLLGYPTNEWLSTPNFSEVVAHEEDREKIARAAAKVVNTGEEGATQFRWFTKDGRQLWVEAHLAPIRDESGKVIGLRGITLDITDRKLADESLRIMEERNRAILRAIPDLMFLHTADGVYLDYQAKDPNDLYVPPSEFLGKNLRDVMPAELAEHFLSAFRRAQETDEPQSVEYALVLNGEERWFEARIVTTQVDKILSVVRDITDRKRAEAALVESEARLGGIVASAMDAIVFIDEDRRIVLFNTAAERIFACTEQQAIGQSFDQFIAGKSRDYYYRYLQTFNGTPNVTTATKQSIGTLGRLVGRRVNGAEFPIDASISQLDLQGKKFYTIILRDITKRKQREEALREVQESLTIALEASRMGTWDLDLTKDFSGHRSLRHDQIFGYKTPQANWGREIARRHIVEEDRETFDAAFARAMATGDLDFEARVRWPDGSIHWMAARGRFYFDENNNPTRGAGVNFDITERKQAEESMRESEERFRNMADNAPVMIWVSDENRLCTYFNKQWLDFTGRTLEQEIGNGWAEGIHKEDLYRCLETYATAFNRRVPFTMEYRLLRADGEYRWVLNTATPRFSSGLKFLGYIGSCIDITERKAAEEALADLGGQLIRARENECARIARELHDDLNQRMAMITIDLDQLSQATRDNKLQRQLKGIMKQATEVSTEIHRLSYDLHPSKLSQLGLVAAVTSLCSETLAKHKLKTEFVHEAVPISLPQDISLSLYRIVQECLHNIVKHSGAQAATVELLGTDNEILLRVSDSGIGFDVESSTMKKGLGLVSMRERLRLVGGILSINSSPSKGTEVCARVPFGRRGSDLDSKPAGDSSRAAGG